MRQEHVLRELLGEGAAALDNPPGPYVDDRRPRQPERVDAKMAIEPPILRRHEGLHEEGRHLVQAHDTRMQIAGRTDGLAGRGNEGEAGAAIEILDLGEVGQTQRIPGQHERKSDAGPEHDDQKPHGEGAYPSPPWASWRCRTRGAPARRRGRRLSRRAGFLLASSEMRFPAGRARRHDKPLGITAFGQELGGAHRARL